MLSHNRRPAAQGHERRITMAQRPSYFVVIGSGPFPADMLRYDECAPYSDIDRQYVDLDVTDTPARESRRAVQLVTHNPHKPTVARWESFGWRVRQASERPVENLHIDPAYFKVKITERRIVTVATDHTVLAENEERAAEYGRQRVSAIWTRIEGCSDYAKLGDPLPDAQQPPTQPGLRKPRASEKRGLNLIMNSATCLADEKASEDFKGSRKDAEDIRAALAYLSGLLGAVGA